MVNYEPMQLEVDNVVMTMSKRAPQFKTIEFDKLRPHLKTEMSKKRPLTQYETLLALVKRNHSIPELSGVVDKNKLADKLHENIMNTYLNDNYDKNLVTENAITIDADSIQDWLEGQPTGTVEKIVNSECVEQTALNMYKYMIKASVKPKLDW